MPKEVIQRPRDNEVCELTVNWDKEQGLVQLGLTRHVLRHTAREFEPGELEPLCRSAPTHADHSYCGACEDAMVEIEKAKATGRQGWSMGDSSFGPNVHEFDGPTTVFTEPMTRWQINTMIRVLRRARDQAHGEDA